MRAGRRTVLGAKSAAKLSGSALTMKLISPWRYSATSLQRWRATRAKPRLSNSALELAGIGRGELDELEAIRAHRVVERHAPSVAAGRSAARRSRSARDRCARVHVAHCAHRLRHAGCAAPCRIMTVRMDARDRLFADIAARLELLTHANSSRPALQHGQHEPGKRLGEIALELGYLTSDELALVRAQEARAIERQRPRARRGGGALVEERGGKPDPRSASAPASGRGRRAPRSRAGARASPRGVAERRAWQAPEQPDAGSDLRAAHVGRDAAAAQRHAAAGRTAARPCCRRRRRRWSWPTPRPARRRPTACNRARPRALRARRCRRRHRAARAAPAGFDAFPLAQATTPCTSATCHRSCPRAPRLRRSRRRRLPCRAPVRGTAPPRPSAPFAQTAPLPQSTLAGAGAQAAATIEAALRRGASAGRGAAAGRAAAPAQHRDAAAAEGRRATSGRRRSRRPRRIWARRSRSRSGRARAICTCTAARR